MILSKILLLFTIFLIPLLGATDKFGYEQIKVLFFILSISLIGFVWLLKRPKFRWDLIKIASLVFIISLLLASGLGIDSGDSFLGKQPYFQGWILYAYLFLFALMVSQIKIKLDNWAFCLTGSSVIVAIWAIKDWVLLNLFHLEVSTYAGRVVASFGQPNFYAGFLLLTLPFSYFLFKSSNKLSYFGLISGAVSTVGILVSYSRSAILMALVLVVLALIDQFRSKFWIGMIAFGILVISILFAWKMSSGLVENEISQPILIKNPDLTKESVEKRAYIWPQAVKIILRKPLTGYGLENINGAFSGFFDTNKHSLFEENLDISPVLISLKELNIDRSHNYILDLLLFSGLTGLSAWIFLVAVLFLRSRNILLVSLITYLIWVQFQNQSVVQLIYFWLLVGLINKYGGIE